MDSCDAYNDDDCGKCTQLELSILGEYEDIYCIGICASTGDRCKRKAIMDEMLCNQHKMLKLRKMMSLKKSDDEDTGDKKLKLRKMAILKKSDNEEEDTGHKKLKLRKMVILKKSDDEDTDEDIEFDNSLAVIRSFSKYVDHDINPFKPLATIKSMPNNQRRTDYLKSLKYQLTTNNAEFMKLFMSEFDFINDVFIDMQQPRRNDYVNGIVVYDKRYMDIAVRAMNNIGIKVHDVQSVLNTIRRRRKRGTNSMDIINVVFGDALKQGIQISEKVRKTMIEIAKLTYT